MSDRWYRWLVVVWLATVAALLALAVVDLNHIRHEQCYTPVLDRGQVEILYVKGCR